MMAGTNDGGASGLFGLKILVVEDETIISFLMEDMLTDLGCAEIWHAGRLADAAALLAEKKPDAALLDVNLQGELVYPIAERLENSRIPFVFTTGYGRGGILPRWLGRPVLQKPFDPPSLAAALRAALDSPVS